MGTDMNADNNALAELRREIDQIDDALHDLVMRRAALAGAILSAKGRGAAVLRPGREAAILRRLLARHSGPLPPAVVVRLWREIIAANAALQGTLGVAALAAPDQPSLAGLARDHFGVLAPIQTFETVPGILRAVSDGQASIGLLPLPSADDDRWWTSLMGDAAPKIVARLPFLSQTSRNSDALEALCVSKAPAEASGRDRSYLAVETKPELSRSSLKRAFTQAKLTLLNALTREETDHWIHLVEVEDFVGERDSRLAALLSGGVVKQARALGAYAVPVGVPDVKSAKS